MVIRQFSAIYLTALAVAFICMSRGGGLRTETIEPAAPARKRPPKRPADEGAGSESNAGPTEIVIHRRRIHLRAPEKYQLSMHLDPVRTVRLAAPFDGSVKSILHKAGDRLESGGEVVRMDTTEKQLRLDRAKALFKVAQIEDSLAGSGKGSAKQLAGARLEAAKADLDLAVYWVEQGAIRRPLIVKSCESKWPRGRSCAWAIRWRTVRGDTTSLDGLKFPSTEMPRRPGTAPRNQNRGSVASFRVRSTRSLPLGSRFETLRDLLPSAASAIVIVPNPDGRLRVGQTVYSPLIPREFVADVPNSCLANLPDGNHKVQVLRNNVVRDVPIATLAAVGPDP